MECPTVKIKVQPSEGNDAGEVVINASDYKPEDGMITVEDYEARVAAARDDAAKQAAEAAIKFPACDQSYEASHADGEDTKDVQTSVDGQPADQGGAGKPEGGRKGKKDK